MPLVLPQGMRTRWVWVRERRPHCVPASVMRRALQPLEWQGLERWLERWRLMRRVFGRVVDEPAVDGRSAVLAPLVAPAAPGVPKVPKVQLALLGPQVCGKAQDLAQNFGLALALAGLHRDPPLQRMEAEG